jgi:hypothetical protein
MKSNIFILLIILISIRVIGQDKPSFIGLQAGLSIPVGGFHSKELPDGGFAELGFSASVSGAWFFKKWIGVGGEAAYQIHPVDAATLGIEKLQSDPFLNEVTVRSESHMSGGLYAGLFFQIPLANRLSLTAKALGGMIYGRTPYQLYKANYYLIGERWFEVTSAGDYEGSFLAGAGLRYDLKNCIGFVLNSAFSYHMMDFTFITGSETTRTDNKVLSFINLNAGIVIKLSGENN